MYYDTLIISDLHLGTPVSKTEKILKVLDTVQFNTLIINGDLIDCHNLKRFKKNHWKVLSKLRKISKTHKVIFVGGNHDGEIEIISLILGLNFVQEYRWQVNGKKFLAVHGHHSDIWAAKFPRLTNFFTGLYYLIQLFDKKQTVCRFLKKKSKTILKVDKSLREEALEIAKKNKVNGIFVGHSHLADYEIKDGIIYINSGSFCESPCNYIVIDKDGNAFLKEI